MSEIDGSGEMETAIGTHVPAREIAHRSPKDQFSPARSLSLHDGPLVRIRERDAHNHVTTRDAPSFVSLLNFLFPCATSVQVLLSGRVVRARAKLSTIADEKKKRRLCCSRNYVATRTLYDSIVGWKFVISSTDAAHSESNNNIVTHHSKRQVASKG